MNPAISTASDFPVCEPEVYHYLSAAHFLRDHAALLTFEQFHDALRRTIGADKAYSRNVFTAFQNNPAAFLAARHPQTQSVEILRAMLRDKDDIDFHS